MHVHVHVPCTCICIAHARTVGEQVDNERTARRSRAVGPRSVYGEGVVEGRVSRLEQHLHMPCMCMHHAYRFEQHLHGVGSTFVCRAYA